MKSLPEVLLGLGDPRDMVVGMMLLFMGMLIITNAQIGIKTPAGDVRWITAFADLDARLGWGLIWIGVDSFFRKKLTYALLSLLNPIFSPIIKGILGEERIKRWRERMGKSKKLAGVMDD